MKLSWWPLLIAVVLPGGLFIAALEIWRRHRAREQAPTLSRDWKAFLEAPAAKGEPEIPPAKVPVVQPLHGVKVNRYTWFRRRMGGE